MQKKTIQSEKKIKTLQSTAKSGWHLPKRWAIGKAKYRQMITKSASKKLGKSVNQLKTLL
jgi:hypothetical protein